MPRRKHPRLTKKRLKQDARNLTIQAGKEYTHLLAYAVRELTGQGHKKPKCTLKKGWFE